MSKMSGKTSAKRQMASLHAPHPCAPSSLPLHFSTFSVKCSCYPAFRRNIIFTYVRRSIVISFRSTLDDGPIGKLGDELLLSPRWSFLATRPSQAAEWHRDSATPRFVETPLPRRTSARQEEEEGGQELLDLIGCVCICDAPGRKEAALRRKVARAGRNIAFFVVFWWIPP